MEDKVPNIFVVNTNGYHHPDWFSFVVEEYESQGKTGCNQSGKRHWFMLVGRHRLIKGKWENRPPDNSSDREWVLKAENSHGYYSTLEDAKEAVKNRLRTLLGE